MPTRKGLTVTDSILHIDRVIEDISDVVQGAMTVVGPGPEALAGADFALVGGAIWDAARFDRAPKVRQLARTGIGVDSVDLDEATRRGVLVTNTPDGPTVSTAEHAAALLLSVAKGLTIRQEELRQARGGYGEHTTGIELDGLTAGLLGFGRIARHMAVICRGFGMNVIVHDPYVDPSDIGASSGVQFVDFDRLLSTSDVLSLHAPLTSETQDLFDAAVFSACRPGVLFVNAARGGLVDHDALVDALDSGQVAAAGLDVTDPEPLPADHTLLHRSNVVVTPHIASNTTVGRRRMLDMAWEQITQVAAGQRPTHLVNPEAWTGDGSYS